MDLKFAQSARELMPWLPLIARRTAHYLGFSTALVVCAGLLALLEASSGPWFACGVAMMALGLYFGFRTTRKLQKKHFLRLQAETLASIPGALTGETPPSGFAQIARAKAHASQAYPDNEDLILISKLVPSILGRTTDTLLKVGKIMPFQPATQWRRANHAVLTRGLGYVSDALNVGILQTSEGNPFEEARRGIVAYGGQWRTMLRAGMRLALRGWTFAAVAILLVEALTLLAFWTFGVESVSARLWMLGTAAYTGCAIKWSIFDPIAALIAARMFSSGEAQQAEGSGWEARVEISSHEYVMLKKAANERAQRVQSFEPTPVESSEAEDVG